MRQEAGIRMPKETALRKNDSLKAKLLEIKPDDDGTGSGLSQQLGQKGHLVAVCSLAITFHHQTVPGPGDHRLLGRVKCTCVPCADMQNWFSNSQTSFALGRATDTSKSK